MGVYGDLLDSVSVVIVNGSNFLVDSDGVVVLIFVILLLIWGVGLV